MAAHLTIVATPKSGKNVHPWMRSDRLHPVCIRFNHPEMDSVQVTGDKKQKNVAP